MQIETKAQMPEAFAGLFEPHRFKVFYGGRGGGKSRSFARALLILGTQRPLRVLCAREIQLLSLYRQRDTRRERHAVPVLRPAFESRKNQVV